MFCVLNYLIMLSFLQMLGLFYNTRENCFRNFARNKFDDISKYCFVPSAVVASGLANEIWRDLRLGAPKITGYIAIYPKVSRGMLPRNIFILSDLISQMATDLCGPHRSHTVYLFVVIELLIPQRFTS